MVLMFVIIIPTFLGVFSLFLYQLGLICKNQTSIEELWSETEKRKADQAGRVRERQRDKRETQKQRNRDKDREKKNERNKLRNRNGQ